MKTFLFWRRIFSHLFRTPSSLVHLHEHTGLFRRTLSNFRRMPQSNRFELCVVSIEQGMVPFEKRRDPIYSAWPPGQPS